MLRSGTVSFRVEQAMTRVATALGVERLDAYVTITGITASIHCGKQHYTQISRVKSLGINMNCVSAVEALSLTIPDGATPDKVNAILDQIEAMPLPYPKILVVLVVAIACGAFAMIEGGYWFECGAAMVGAGLGQALRFILLKTRLNPISVVVLCSITANSLCSLTLGLCTLVGWVPETPDIALLASVLFLVPGAVLITAALDLVRFDLLSGMSRVMYAVMVFFCIAIGIVLTMPFTRLTIA